MGSVGHDRGTANLLLARVIALAAARIDGALGIGANRGKGRPVSSSDRGPIKGEAVNKLLGSLCSALAPSFSSCAHKIAAAYMFLLA